MSVIQDVIDMLETANVTTYDETPDIEPTGLYAQIVDSAGTAQPHRLSTTAHWVSIPISVMGVGRTKDSCRHLLTLIRGALTGVRPHPGAKPLLEESSGPLLKDGPAGDEYWSGTINYKAHVLTRGALE